MTDPSAGPTARPQPGAEDEVVDLCRDLIRIDTTNTGDEDTTVGEAEAAEYVIGRLQQVGLDPVRIETTGPTRQAVAVRIPGRDSGRGALLVHGHLDVVPAHADDWTVDPFSAELVDGMIWGRGAVDMKNMDAMILSAVRHWQRTGSSPQRDVVVLFTPDEEAGGRQGAHWLVDHHPELFHGVTEAVGEVGGFSLTLREDVRVYLIQVAEKGLAWMRLRARAPAGHGSFVHDRSAVLELAEAVTRLGRHRFPIEITPPVAGLIRALGELLDVPIDPRDPAQLTEVLGPIARIIGATLHHTANPTVLSAGYKVNVLPEEAVAEVDGRFLPGGREEFLSVIDELIGPDVQREMINLDEGVETDFGGPTIEAMAAALRWADPHAVPVPYTLSGGTDAKAFSRLGIRCYGFAPLLLPPDLDFASLFHGVDERVPVQSLRFGARVLERFLVNA